MDVCFLQFLLLTLACLAVGKSKRDDLCLLAPPPVKSLGTQVLGLILHWSGRHGTQCLLLPPSLCPYRLFASVGSLGQTSEIFLRVSGFSKGGCPGRRSITWKLSLSFAKSVPSFLRLGGVPALGTCASQAEACSLCSLLPLLVISASGV